MCIWWYFFMYFDIDLILFAIVIGCKLIGDSFGYNKMRTTIWSTMLINFHINILWKYFLWLLTLHCKPITNIP